MYQEIGQIEDFQATIQLSAYRGVQQKVFATLGIYLRALMDCA